MVTDISKIGWRFSVETLPARESPIYIYLVLVSRAFSENTSNVVCALILANGNMVIKVRFVSLFNRHNMCLYDFFVLFVLCQAQI